MLQNVFSSLLLINLISFRRLEEISLELQQPSLFWILHTWRLNREVVPKRRYEITTTRCVITQKNAVLSPISPPVCFSLIRRRITAPNLTLRDSILWLIRYDICIYLKIWDVIWEQWQVLGAFAKSRKATISFVMSVRLSDRPHGIARLPLDGFSVKSDIWVFFEESVE